MGSDVFALDLPFHRLPGQTPSAGSERGCGGDVLLSLGLLTPSIPRREVPSLAAKALPKTMLGKTEPMIMLHGVAGVKATS
jgi:hypothetical protein